MFDSQQFSAFSYAQIVAHMQGIQQNHGGLIQPRFRHFFGFGMQNDSGCAFQLHACRQGGTHHFSKRTHVVIRHPPKHLTLRRSHDWGIIHQSLDSFCRVTIWRCGVNLPNHTRPFFVSQGHHHPASRHWRFAWKRQPPVSQGFWQCQRHNHLNKCWRCR